MINSKDISGFYGYKNGRSEEGRVRISYVSRGLSDTLSVEFKGKGRIEIAFRQVYAMINAVRAERRQPAAPNVIEKSIIVEGLFTGGNLRNINGRVAVWFRNTGAIEMLSLDFEDSALISIPYAPVEQLIKADKSRLA